MSSIGVQLKSKGTRPVEQGRWQGAKKVCVYVCVCVSSMLILWTHNTTHTRNGRIVPHSCSTGSCQSESVLLGEGDGVLVVENMQTEDAGYYECTATIEGTVASQICKVTVGGKLHVHVLQQLM